MMIHVVINGEQRTLRSNHTVLSCLEDLSVDSSKVAIELNHEIVPRSSYETQHLQEGDTIEIVHFIGGGEISDQEGDNLVIAGRVFKSRLLVGTGKYKDFDQTRDAIRASGAEIVTVAVRRVNLNNSQQPMIVDYIDPKTYTYMPNTAGCYTAEDAVRTLRLARDSGGWDLVKLEVLGDHKLLYPDMVETLKAAEILVKENFDVMVYCTDDPILCKRLEDIGCAAIMPLAAPIGSGLGVQNKMNIGFIIEQSSVPVLVDAGLGTASDAAIVMEMGCDGVLLNTAIAGAKDPILMAHAMKYAVQAGRQAYRAGRVLCKTYASASSSSEGLLS